MKKTDFIFYCRLGSLALIVVLGGTLLMSCSKKETTSKVELPPPASETAELPVLQQNVVPQNATLNMDPKTSDFSFHQEPKDPDDEKRVVKQETTSNID